METISQTSTPATPSPLPTLSNLNNQTPPPNPSLPQPQTPISPTTQRFYAHATVLDELKTNLLSPTIWFMKVTKTSPPIPYFHIPMHPQTPIIWVHDNDINAVNPTPPQRSALQQHFETPHPPPNPLTLHTSPQPGWDEVISHYPTQLPPMGTNPHLNLSLVMKIATWNCHRADNQIFVMHAQDLINVHAPNSLILLETKLSDQGALSAARSLGFTRKHIIDLEGAQGGIWIPWQPVKLKSQW